MSDPFRMITSYADDFISGNLDAVVACYALPIVASATDESTILDTPEAAMAYLVKHRSDLIASGITGASVDVISQFVTDRDIAFVLTRNELHDADDKIVKRCHLAYVLRHGDDGWKIQVVNCH